MWDSPVTLTERQERRLEEFTEEVERHGAEAPVRPGIRINPRPESRPGRGHDLDVSYMDSDVVASAFVDVYGNGNQYFGEVDWTCQPEEECEECMDEG